MKEIKCIFCRRVMETVRPSGVRRFFCWLIGHGISRSEFNTSGVPHPTKKEYCHREQTCVYCREEVGSGSFV